MATASWDKTVRLWNSYSGDKSATEILQHSHEVLCVAHHPTGRSLAAATLNGEIHFWDCQDGKLTGMIEVCPCCMLPTPDARLVVPVPVDLRLSLSQCHSTTGCRCRFLSAD